MHSSINRGLGRFCGRTSNRIVGLQCDSPNRELVPQAPAGATMGPIRLIAAPLRRIANSRLFQLAVVVALILLLDHYSYDYGALRPIAEGLKNLVTATE